MQFSNMFFANNKLIRGNAEEGKKNSEAQGVDHNKKYQIK